VPYTSLGSLQHPLDTLAVFKGPTLKVGGKRRGEEEMGNQREAKKQKLEGKGGREGKWSPLTSSMLL